MRRSSKQYAEIFARIVREVKPSDLPALTASFISLLARENALSRFHEIVRLLEGVLERESGIKELILTTAVPMTAAALHDVSVEAATHGFNVVRSVTDERISGGAVIRAADRRVDASVEGMLHQLYETLTSS